MGGAILFFFASVAVAIGSTEVLIRLGFGGGWVFYFWLPRQLPLLALGIILFFENERSPSGERWLGTFHLFLLLVVFLYFVADSDFLDRYFYIAVGMLFFLIVEHFKGMAPCRSKGFLALLGRNTLGIYLFHIAFSWVLWKEIGQIILDLLTTNVVFNTLIYGLYVFVLLIISLGYSLLVSLLVKKRGVFLRKIRRERKAHDDVDK